MNRRFLVSAVLVLSITLVLWILIPHVYYINDDRMIMEFVSGRYTGEPEPYSIYTGFLFSWLLSRFYMLLPNVDWYMVVLLLCNVGSLLIHVYYVVKRLSFKYIIDFVYPIIAVANFLVFYACAYITPTYTITCAAICFAMITVAALGSYSKKDIVLLSVMGVVAYNIRAMCFYMCLPLLLLFLLYRILHSRNKQRMCVGMTVLFLSVIIGGSAAITNAAYGGTEWKAFMEYTDARTDVYDYAMQGEGEQIRSYITEHVDINPIQYSCFLQYSLLLEPELENLMFDIAELYHLDKSAFIEKTSAEQIVAGVMWYKYLILWALLLAGTAILIAVLKRSKHLKEILLAIIGCIAIVVWLFIGGRMPERVIHPAISLIALSAVIWLVLLREKQRRIRIESLIVPMLLVAGIAVSLVMVRDSRRTFGSQYRSNEEYKAFLEYCQDNSDKVYFLTAASLPKGCNYSILTENSKLGYIGLGDWDAFSPLSDKMLNSYGITDVRNYLSEHDNARLAVAKAMNNAEGHFEWLTYTLPASWTYTLEDVVGVYEIYSINRE